MIKRYIFLFKSDKIRIEIEVYLHKKPLTSLINRQILTPTLLKNENGTRGFSDFCHMKVGGDLGFLGGTATGPTDSRLKITPTNPRYIARGSNLVIICSLEGYSEQFVRFRNEDEYFSEVFYEGFGD